ncbi:MAG: hypothetical protein JRJ57_10705 [Deltaproteobacteria bacterium]|nr:hypothetical protein [Deltaproteobacteria bacterium]
MSIFDLKLFSIVFIGRQNPQILNHDFLIKNEVLPVKREPFKSLIKDSSQKKPPFTSYLSTPVVTALDYKWISIIVEENRFQIKDAKFKVPSKSPIITITKEYFGTLLKYTPFQLGGINFGGELKFSDLEEERNFDDRLGIDNKKFETYFKVNKIRISNRITFPWNDDQLELRIDKPKKDLNISNLNFNFEFTYENIDSFIGKLGKVDKVYMKFKEILRKLNVEMK